MKFRQKKLEFKTLADPRALTSESQSRMGLFQVKGVFASSITAFVKRFVNHPHKEMRGWSHMASPCAKWVLAHRDSLILRKLWLPGNLEASLSEVRKRPTPVVLEGVVAGTSAPFYLPS